MPLKPEERRLREFGDALLAVLRNLIAKQEQIHHDLTSLLHLLSPPIQERVNSVSSQQTTAQQDAEPSPLATIHAITQPSDAFIEQRKAEQKSANAFQRHSLIVQWSLFVATFLAFGAAAYYAHVARLQKDTMEKTFGEIKDANRLTEESIRGRIAFVNSRIITGIAIGRPVTVIVDWKNIGHSPTFGRWAEDVKRWRGMPEGDMPVAMPGSDVKDATAPEGTGQLIMTDFVPLTSDFLRGLPRSGNHKDLNESETIYFFGRVVYETAGRQHHADYCAYLMDLSNIQLAPPIDSRYILRQCPKWHSSD